MRLTEAEGTCLGCRLDWGGRLLPQGWRAHRLSPACPYLPSSIELVSEFDFAERHRRLHPVGPEVGRVWVDVDAAGRLRLWLAPRYPLPIHILPAVVVSRHEVQQEGVHGIGVQTGHIHLQHWEHPPGKDRAQQEDPSLGERKPRTKCLLLAKEEPTIS